jgi:hypothetical protein
MSMADIDASSLLGLPAEAQCFECGYSLRGLTEPRCPKCGTRFDPRDYVHGVVPKWPMLAVFVLLMMLARQLLFVFVEGFKYVAALWAGLPAGGAIHALLAAGQLTISVGIIVAALVGLWRRREWGRKVALVALGLLVASSLVGLVWGLIVTHQAVAAGVVDQLNPTLIVMRSLCRGVLPYGMMLAFLATGMRKHSLSRGGRQHVRIVPQAQYSARQDWLLATVIVIASIGLQGLPDLVVYRDQMLLSVQLRQIRGFGSVGQAVDVASPIVHFAMPFVAAWVGVGVWRRPGRLRRFLVVLVAAASIEALVVFLDRFHGFVLSVPGALWSATRGLVLPVAMALFARYALRREDVLRAHREAYRRRKGRGRS